MHNTYNRALYMCTVDVTIETLDRRMTRTEYGVHLYYTRLRYYVQVNNIMRALEMRLYYTVTCQTIRIRTIFGITPTQMYTIVMRSQVDYVCVWKVNVTYSTTTDYVQSYNWFIIVT